MTIILRDATASDEAAWRGLWAGYNAFYETTLPPGVTTRTWARILDPASPLLCRLAEAAGTVAGFSVSVLHEGTWSVEPVCYLEDLFVAPERRGGGLGRRLIRDLVDLGRRSGWGTLYWHTRRDNPARRLYDDFVVADDFVRYRLKL